MISARATEVLLDKLCVKLGFCLDPDSYAQLVASPPSTVLTFTDAVFVAEGLEPSSQDRRLYRNVRDYVVEAFENYSEDS